MARQGRAKSSLVPPTRELEQQGLSVGVGSLTFCLSSSERASLRTLAQGRSLGHQRGRVDSLPHPGLPRPVEYLSISGMKARSWAYEHPPTRLTKSKGLILTAHSLAKQTAFLIVPVTSHPLGTSTYTYQKELQCWQLFFIPLHPLSVRRN